MRTLIANFSPHWGTIRTDFMVDIRHASKLCLGISDDLTLIFVFASNARLSDHEHDWNGETEHCRANKGE